MSNEVQPPATLPEPKVKLDPEFEALYKQAEVAYPDMPKFLLRVALMTALREEEAHQKKRLPKRKHIIDLANAVEDEYRREVPESLEYYGMEIIPPKDSEHGEVVELVSENSEEPAESVDPTGQRVDLEGGRGTNDAHVGGGISTAV